jgi:NAD-dependent dihydropyrimidine dehydrogenase PreA subunit
VILNGAYATLSNPVARDIYDEAVHLWRKEMGNFDGRPVSRWSGSECEQRAVFVDETTCIGCRHCTQCAPNTFAMVRVAAAAHASVPIEGAQFL